MAAGHGTGQRVRPTRAPRSLGPEDPPPHPGHTPSFLDHVVPKPLPVTPRPLGPCGLRPTDDRPPPHPVSCSWDLQVPVSTLRPLQGSQHRQKQGASGLRTHPSIPWAFRDHKLSGPRPGMSSPSRGLVRTLGGGALDDVEEPRLEESALFDWLNRQSGRDDRCNLRQPRRRA